MVKLVYLFEQIGKRGKDVMQDILIQIEKALGFSLGSLSLGKVMNALLVLLICMIIIRVLMKMLRRVMERAKVERALLNFTLSVCHVLLYILTGLIVADSLGIPISSLIAVFSVLGLAVSLAVQNTLSNLAGGLMILVSKPFVADHYVEAGGVGGTVKEIGLIYTKVATPDNKVIYIPNSDISSARIINYSAEENRRIDVAYTASYDAPLENVKKAVFEAVAAIPEILPDPEPVVVVTNYGDSAIEYTVRVWVKNADYWPVKFALNEAVKAAFDKEGVEMTYPHLNVHLMNNVPAAKE